MRILIAIMFFVSAVLSACGDGAQTQSGPSPTLAGKAELQDVKPAQMVSLSLKELGLPAGADKVTPSGAVSNALLKDGQLRFSTPGDTGKDQEASFEIKSGPTTSQFHVVIRSQRPTSAEAYDDSTDNGYSSPDLIVDGLVANNVMTGAPLTFRMQGVSTLDLKEQSAGRITTDGNTTILVQLEKFWSFNPADSSFSISGPAMQRILDTLPKGSFGMHLYFAAKDGEFAASYDMQVSKAETRLSGNLLSERGDPVTSLAGREVLLNGVNTQTRAVAVLDANGAFAFEHVLPDVYFLTLSDLHYPNVVSTSFPIYEGSTQAKVTMVVPPGLGIDTGAKAAAQRVAAPGSSAVRSSVTQDGKEPPPRDIPASKRSSPAAPLPADEGDRAVFSVTAAEQDRPINKNFDFEVPAGTESVGVRITVLTEESRASAKNRGTHVDSWSYSVVGLPDSGLSASGLVDQMYGTDRIAKRACVNVSKQTKNAALKISGSVSATNIGDGLLPTTTTVELSLECMRPKSSSTNLKVVSAKFSSPNKNSNPIISPLKVSERSNLAGSYLSIPQSRSDNTNTIPLEIRYSPDDATITEVNLGITQVNATTEVLLGTSPGVSTLTFSNVNLLTQNHTREPGLIKFPGLSLPTFSGAMAMGNITVTVRLKGSVGGAAVSSDPAADAEHGQVEFNEKKKFTPLYLAGDVTGLSDRRFGIRDTNKGGDSWSTTETIAWLLGCSLCRFNDVSSQHVAQVGAEHDSILVHKGHSDGQQIDLRYADGLGDYSDVLGGQDGGAHIRQLLNAAKTEIAENAARAAETGIGSWFAGPKQRELEQWIIANRAILQIEGNKPYTRVIFIGGSFIKQALIDGQFPDNSTIPVVGAWTTKPATVEFTPDGHMDHWHISLKGALLYK
ncbi:hypothetical protein [Verminephrobacter aporrectodeae]|uniref:hypothetical protein n=1 Tax=Verminephrobacter aporrectodeae TaxID=1110389 RepID=UPI00224308A0|nr:hypothetical protein [Verminephrobacter aporrectodeae]